MRPLYLPQTGAKEKLRWWVAGIRRCPELAAMWSEPYLETCCRAALHRLKLSGAYGRPDGLKDGPCLHRIAAMGLAEWRDQRFVLTQTGDRRHEAEIARPWMP